MEYWPHDEASHCPGATAGNRGLGLSGTRAREDGIPRLDTFYFDVRSHSVAAAPEVLAKAFSAIHLALVNLRTSAVSVSFPEQDDQIQSLGACLRVMGPARDVEAVAALPWHRVVQDQASVSNVGAVPDTQQFRGVRRVQAKSNVERLRRRYVARHGVAYDEACRLIQDDARQTLDLPWLRIKSHSSHQEFRLFLRMDDSRTDLVPGDFNAYGLSATATIPWF
jgi:CRISPR-associated endonuclease Csy4